ncbi:MAG: DUF4198 domain-containing protein [Proteobacteria bacterium]|nr:DUF4198 domain-containing protein [Pseudomonadota bacterium]
MRVIVPLLLFASWAATAAAHDLWLQPQRFWAPVRTSVPVAILVGHGADRAPWGVAADRVVMLKDVGPTGTSDLMSGLKGRVAAEIPGLSFGAPGVHIIAMQSIHSASELPAVRFNNYLQEEGLTPALAIRSRARATNAAGREIYSRRAKALVQVGPPGSPQPHVTRPIGLTLEIVPERNPYAPGPSNALPVRVFYEGRLLPGALVKLTNLDADAKPVAMRRTDAAGRAVFTPPRTGSWLLNVVWTKPIKGDRRGDFDTTFSSLTWGFPRAAVR